jgi:rhodanese-related sulfurtransferase
MPWQSRKISDPLERSDRLLLAGGLKSFLGSIAGPLTLILFLSAATGVTFNWLKPEPLAWDYRLDPGNAPSISDFAEFESYLSKPATVLLDARNQALFQIGHIPGAINLPAEEAPLKAKSFLESLPPETLIITYCSESLCPLADKLAETLITLGHNNVLVFSPGFDVWEESGRPVETIAP